MNKKGARKWLMWGGLVFLVMLIAGMPCQSVAEKPKYGGHLRYTWEVAASSLDPHLGRAGGDALYWKQMYDQLVGADSKLVSRPELSLAESWEISEPTIMTFHLRKGVKFHDGTDFNAEAVKFNIDRILDPEVGATPRAGFSVIKTVEVVDPYTVKFHLKNPWGAGLSMLADRGGAINSPTAIKKWGREYGFHPVATGPFKFVEYVSGSHFKAVRNEKYWGKDADGNPLPYLDSITLRIIKDPAVRTAAMKAGELDLAFLEEKDVDRFEADPKFNVDKFEGSRIYHLLAFNIRMSPMDNTDLRRAVAYAINPEAINKSAFFGKAIVAKAGMWPPGCWVYDDTVPRPYYDIEKAKGFLKAGGKPNGFSVDLITFTRQNLIQTAEIMKAQLARIGINMNIKTYSVKTAVEKFYHTNEAPIFSTAFSRYPEPDWIASLCYKSDGYYNPGKVKNQEMDELVRKGASLYDINERKAIYRKINEIVLGDVWVVPMIYAYGRIAAPKKVQGLDTVFHYDGKLVVKKLWLK